MAKPIIGLHGWIALVEDPQPVGYHNLASQARTAKTELKVGFEPTTCGLRNRGDPSVIVNLNEIRHFFKPGGIQK